MRKQRHTFFEVFAKSLLFAVVFSFITISNLKSQVFDLDSIESVASEDDILDEDVKQNEIRTENKLSAKNVSVRALADKNKNNYLQSPDKHSSKKTVNNLRETVAFDTNEEINLYMRNFKITRNLSGRVSCSMRFYLESKVKEKINNISYRLKWSKMETALSFSGVESERTVYVDYTLLGEGCYEMDTAPNIIVNRCRIKGRTQEACASLIKWRK